MRESGGGGDGARGKTGEEGGNKRLKGSMRECW